MKTLLLLTLTLLSTIAFGADSDSALSFINATKSDNLIAVGKVVSYPNYDPTKGSCPPKMIVEVSEILKGSCSSKLITIEGSDELSSNNLTCLHFFKVGSSYIFGLDNFKLIATGNHSLEYLNGIVKGNVSNEPTEDYLKKLKRIVDKLQKEELNKSKNAEKIDALRKDLESHSKSLDQTIHYKTFKEVLLGAQSH